MEAAFWAIIAAQDLRWLEYVQALSDAIREDDYSKRV